jgi:hypothetical protein
MLLRGELGKNVVALAACKMSFGQPLLLSTEQAWIYLPSDEVLSSASSESLGPKILIRALSPRLLFIVRGFLLLGWHAFCNSSRCEILLSYKLIAASRH